MSGVRNDAGETGTNSEHGGRNSSNARTPRASKRASCSPRNEETTRDQEDGIETGTPGRPPQSFNETEDYVPGQNGEETGAIS